MKSKDHPKSKEKSSKTKAKLLSGDNPQIPKGYGDEPVSAYLDAIPGWKKKTAVWIDRLIANTCPNVKKAVKWNSPFYGVRDDYWFLSYHCFSKYVKVTFFKGTSLKPMPPGESKQNEVRYWHIYEGDLLDEVQFKKWVKQAIKLPGEKL